MIYFHKVIKTIVIGNICIVLYSLQRTFTESISLEPPSSFIRRQRINHASIRQLKKFMMKEAQLFARVIQPVSDRLRF